jgi:hypothetical protein
VNVTSDLLAQLPDRTQGELYQQLQVLNCCILLQRMHDEVVEAAAAAAGRGAAPDGGGAELAAEGGCAFSDLDNDDLFHDALSDSPERRDRSRTASTHPSTHTHGAHPNGAHPIGAHPIGAHPTSNSDTAAAAAVFVPLVDSLGPCASCPDIREPVTRRRVLMTGQRESSHRDLIAGLVSSSSASEQTSSSGSNNNTNDNNSALLRQLLSSELVSEIQAFKAANANSSPADFVRWWQATRAAHDDDDDNSDRFDAEAMLTMALDACMDRDARDANTTNTPHKQEVRMQT